MLQAATHRRLLHPHAYARRVLQQPVAAGVCPLQIVADHDEHVRPHQHPVKFGRLHPRVLTCYTKQFRMQVSWL